MTRISCLKMNTSRKGVWHIPKGIYVTGSSYESVSLAPNIWEYHFWANPLAMCCYMSADTRWDGPKHILNGRILEFPWPWLFLWMSFFFFFFLLFTFETERDRAWTGKGQREGDTESETGSRLWAVSTEPDAGLELTDREIMTWAEVSGLTDWATQAPLLWMS